MKGDFIVRRTVAKDRKNAAGFRPVQEAVPGPPQGFPVDVFLEQLRVQHDTQVVPGPPPGGVRSFVDDVKRFVQPTGMGR